MSAAPDTASTLPPLKAVGMLSAAVLAYELLLMRLFAIVHWHHFAFMMISIALLGYGASGTFLSLLSSMRASRLRWLFPAGAAGFSIACVICFLAAQRLPFNALEVFWNPRQWAYLAGIYGLLFLPFFFAATSIGAVLRFSGSRIPQLYAADLCGASLGACVTVGLLFRATPSTALVIVAGTGVLAAATAAVRWQLKRRTLLIAAAAGGITLLGLGTVLLEIPTVNAYKPLAQALQIPGTRMLHQRHHPMGWLSVVQRTTIPFRYAPGLSLKSDAAIPDQIAIFMDGQAMSVVDRDRHQPETRTYLRQATLSMGMQLRPQAKRILIVNAGGGQDILRAKAYGGHQIDAVDPHPGYVSWLQNELADFWGGHLQGGRIHYHDTTVRAFLQPPRKPYNLIQLPPGTNGGSGGSAFGENTLLTIEGLAQLWQYLQPGGLLVVPLWTRLPPRGSLKAFHMALIMLEDQGIDQPSDHLAMIRDWRTAVMLIAKSPLTNVDQNAVRSFCRRWGFDRVFLPSLRPGEVNRYNILAEPFFAEATQALVGDDREAFCQNYKFNLRPATDDRPFFGHFFKWRALPEIAALRAAGGIALLDWGYPVLLATLAQAMVFSLVFIGLPVLKNRFSQKKYRIGRQQGMMILLYFSVVGGGFLLLEIAYMQRLAVVLHHPLVAATLTLAGFLLGAGIGSICAYKAVAKGMAVRRLLQGSLATVCLVGLLELAALPWLMARLGSMPLGFAAASALGLIMPLGVAMGMPFPLGLALLNRHWPEMIPWAWGINGCSTVVNAVAAPLIAISMGYTGVITLAILLYAVGFVLVPWILNQKTTGSDGL